MPIVTHQNNPQAVGDFDPATRKITLLPGSILSIDPGNQEVFDNIQTAYDAALEAIRDGSITRDQSGKLRVAVPIPNLNPARAHVFATGLRGNGWYLWKLENGDPIDVYRNEDQDDGPIPISKAGDPHAGAEPQPRPVSPQQGGDAPRNPQPPLPPTYGGAAPREPNDCLSIYRLPPVPDYLRRNRHRILALGAQALPPWSNGYNAFPQPVMNRLREAFPDRIISRADVVALCESWHDPVLCLVAAMVWGGISIAGFTGDNLTPLLLMGEPALLARMEALRTLVRSGALEQAFEDCSPQGGLKFDGVGFAYFTKLFYFLGQVPPVLNPAPLILDRWTSLAFLVLGKQVCDSPLWREWFNTEALCEDDVPLWRAPRPTPAMYRIYVAWFNHWAQELGTPAAQLEQFVFGWSLHGPGNVPWNPRNELIALGKTLFCPPPAA
jgi:hypothetical protein